MHDRAVVITDGRRTLFVQHILLDHLPDVLVGEIRIDRTDTIAQQRGKLMHIPRFTALQHDRDRRLFLRAHQMLFQRRHRQQRRDRQMFLIHAAIAQDQDVGTAGHGLITADKQHLQRFFQGEALIEQQGDLFHLKRRLFQCPDLIHVAAVQDRISHLQKGAVAVGFFQQVALRAQIDRRIGDDLLPQRIDRRIGDLGKLLFEIMKQQWMPVAEHGQRDIRSHRCGRLCAAARHRQDLFPYILIRVAKYLIKGIAFLLGEHLRLFFRRRQIFEPVQATVQPLPIWMAVHIARLALRIADETVFLRIHQQHLSGTQAVLAHDVRFIDRQHTDL